MTRTFIQTREFSKNWDRLGLDDEDLRRLEKLILENPQGAPVVSGTGKLRKLRFAINNMGKSGSTRVCYVNFLALETIYLVTVYPKNEKDNLTKEECNMIRNMIAELEKSLKSEV